MLVLGGKFTLFSDGLFAGESLSISGVFGQSEDGAGLRRFGLFIGSNDGGGGRVTLAYAGSDARAVSEVMSEMGGIHKNDRIILQDPSPEDLNESFIALREQIIAAKDEARRVEFMVYYSGHSDEEGIMLGDDHYGYRELRNNVMNMGSDVNIAILDSCSSGAFTRLKGGSRQSPFLFDESVNTKGHAFLTSSSEDEAAQESDSISGSFFTHYFVSALRGAADSTRDGIVTLNEAYTYAFNETLSRTATTLAGPQHASHEINLSGSGELILTDLRVATAGVVLGEDIKGRMFIKDQSGRMVAEIRKEAGLPLTLALPAGRYSVTLDNGDTLLAANISLSRSDKFGLEIQQFSPIAAEVATVRGGGAVIAENEPQEEWTDPLSDVIGIASDIGELMSNLIHLRYSFNLFPRFPLGENNDVVHDLSLKLVGSSYRIEGVDIGLLNVVTQDMLGSQVAGIGNIVGNEVRGAQMGGVFSITEGDIRGGQASGVFNISNGDVYGAQIGGMFNLSGGDLRGGQAAGVFNIAESAEWIQAAGVFNIVTGKVVGLQGAGVFNITSGSTAGLQLAGVFNINDSMVHGLQASGVFNIANRRLNGLQAAGVVNILDGSLYGVQTSGVVNIAGDVRGLQLGLVNIGDDVRGSQIGLVNISRAMYGVPLGLINISGNGLHDPQIWTDDTGFTYVGLQMGAGFLYTLLYAGAPYDDPLSSVSLGLGMGIHANFRPFYLDVDASMKSTGSGADASLAIQDAAMAYSFTEDLIEMQAVKMYPMLRATLGLKLFRSIAIFGGMSLEVQIPGFTEKNQYFHSGDPWLITGWTAPGGPVELYPRWFFGLRI